MGLIELRNVLIHVGVCVVKLQDCWVASDALCCLGAPVWQLNALLERMLVLQNAVHVLLNRCWHHVECTHLCIILKSIDRGRYLLTGHCSPVDWAQVC